MYIAVMGVDIHQPNHIREAQLTAQRGPIMRWFNDAGVDPDSVDAYGEPRVRWVIQPRSVNHTAYRCSDELCTQPAVFNGCCEVHCDVLWDCCAGGRHNGPEGIVCNDFSVVADNMDAYRWLTGYTQHNVVYAASAAGQHTVLAPGKDNWERSRLLAKIRKNAGKRR